MTACSCGCGRDKKNHRRERYWNVDDGHYRYRFRCYGALTCFQPRQ